MSKFEKCVKKNSSQTIRTIKGFKEKFEKCVKKNSSQTNFSGLLFQKGV